MRFHNMTILNHNPAKGITGDCFRTTLACLLDCDKPEDVPHFMEEMMGEEVSNEGLKQMWLRINDWLSANHGVRHMLLPYDGDLELQEVLDMIGGIADPRIMYMLSGRSKIDNHVVICKGNKIIHDTNPNNKPPYLYGPGINPADGQKLWWVEFLVLDSSISKGM